MFQMFFLLLFNRSEKNKKDAYFFTTFLYQFPNLYFYGNISILVTAPKRWSKKHNKHFSSFCKNVFNNFLKRFKCLRHVFKNAQIPKFIAMKLNFNEKQFEIDFLVNLTCHKSYEIVNINLLRNFLLTTFCACE